MGRRCEVHETGAFGVGAFRPVALGRDEQDDEGVDVFRRPEGVHLEAGRGWDAGGGHLPPDQCQASDLLHIEEELRGRAPSGMRWLVRIEDLNATLEELADLSLDREMRQDVVSR